ncbi:hypothetical protein DUD61_001961 [Geotrichum candidum]|uniref:Acyl carrier protein n=1 Tax=Geotrichum candidum TaxID=1173061 RepID=A0A0J9XB60_GEOCN|nr:hypothetical protein DV454_004705 [Geotrichum candidum]KAI8134405.1 hypothetical protein DUD61_001961 [Geotrichum candidum]CDO54422.1 similar to Saccharomyces cerevisiae YKL192C ACP1 Mitochondrial matrix acyl carrier protein [Geotrichum candidum]
MFRNTAARSLARVASASLRRTIATRVSQSAFRSSIPSASLSQRLILSQQQSQVRFYSAGPAPLTNAFVLERITALLSNYDKVPENFELKPETSFTTDLGLDSLDVVEVILAVEEEFSIEIPDHEADSLKTIGQTVEYILQQPDAL